MTEDAKIPVTVLGATGLVGQKLVALLIDHPWFEIAALSASERHVGKAFAEAGQWRERRRLPDRIARMGLRAAEPGLPGRLVFSALDAEVAGTIEEVFASSGYTVLTNARPHRLDPDVPLLIPEINACCLDLLPGQRRRRGWSGSIVSNPNCCVAALALALAPLHRTFGVERVVVTTLQAASGGGYPGVASLDLLANVIPEIKGEEEKIEQETQKILGAAFPVSVHANRVPVLDGHMESVSVELGSAPTLDEARELFQTFRPPEDVAKLPTAPLAPLAVHDRPDRPQPRLDVELGGGMQVSIGRLRPCPVFHLRFTVLGHNLVRGAGGAALLNAELLVARGLVEGAS